VESEDYAMLGRRSSAADSLPSYDWQPPGHQSGTAAELLRRAGSPPGSRDSLAATVDARRSPLGSFSSMASSIGSAQHRSQLQLPSPLISLGEDGETYAFSGEILPNRQENERIIITRLRSNKVVARIHIAEDDKGSGMMVELESQTRRAQARDPQVSPFVFLDTTQAVSGNGERMPKNRKVGIFGASEDGVECTSNPSAIMKVDSQRTSGGGSKEYRRCVLILNGEIILSVACDPKKKDKFSHVEGKDSRLLARIQIPGNGLPLTVHCAPGIDAGLVLCGIAAAIKLL